MVAPSTVTGSPHISKTFRAAVCATITEVPSVLIPVCKISVPRFTRLDIIPMESPPDNIVRTSDFSSLKCLRST